MRGGWRWPPPLPHSHHATVLPSVLPSIYCFRASFINGALRVNSSKTLTFPTRLPATRARDPSSQRGMRRRETSHRRGGEGRRDARVGDKRPSPTALSRPRRKRDLGRAAGVEYTPSAMYSWASEVGRADCVPRNAPPRRRRPRNDPLAEEEFVQDHGQVDKDERYCGWWWWWWRGWMGGVVGSHRASGGGGNPESEGEEEEEEEQASMTPAYSTAGSGRRRGVAGV
jgi:hypothetical protein